MKFKNTLLLVAMVCLALPAFAQGERGNAEVTIKGKKISISYGRPSLQGRDVLSQFKAGQVWRLGMNQATEIDTAADIVVAGKPLKAGKYSLWLKKAGDTSYILAFHPKTGMWGAPSMTEGYVAELPLKLEKAESSAEELTISLADNKGKGWVKIQWGTALLSGAFDVK